MVVKVKLLVYDYIYLYGDTVPDDWSAFALDYVYSRACLIGRDEAIDMDIADGSHQACDYTERDLDGNRYMPCVAIEGPWNTRSS